MNEFIYIIIIAFLLASLYQLNEAIENNKHKSDGWFEVGIKASILGALASTIAVVCYFALKEINLIVNFFGYNIVIKDGVLVFVSTFIPFFTKELISLGKRFISGKGA